MNAYFLVPDKNGNTTELKAELSKRFNTQKEANAFLEKCKTAEFTVADRITSYNVCYTKLLRQVSSMPSPVRERR